MAGKLKIILNTCDPEGEERSVRNLKTLALSLDVVEEELPGELLDCVEEPETFSFVFLKKIFSKKNYN